MSEAQSPPVKSYCVSTVLVASLELEQLEGDIRRVFASVDRSLTLDYLGPDIEPLECRAVLSGRTWQTLSEESVMGSFDCITWLRKEDQLAVLPIWMIASAKYPQENVNQWTVAILHSEAMQLHGLMNNEQRQIVHYFLQYLIDRYEDAWDEIAALEVWKRLDFS